MTESDAEPFSEERLAELDACLEKAFAFASKPLDQKRFNPKSPRVKVQCLYHWGGISEPTMPFEIYKTQISGVHHFLNIWVTMTRGNFKGFSADPAELVDKK